MFRIWPLFFIGMALLVFSAPAHAESKKEALLQRLIEQPQDTLSKSILSVTEDKALRLTSNKNVLVRLDQDAASVIVSNPNNVAIMLDSPRLLIVMPRLPGATSFTVLNGSGETILQKDVIVTNVQPQYVRIRRMCSGSDSSCMSAAYYYCPDGCYEVTPVSPGSSGNIPAPPATAAAREAVNAAASLGPAAPAAGSTSGEPK